MEGGWAVDSAGILRFPASGGLRHAGQDPSTHDMERQLDAASSLRNMLITLVYHILAPGPRRPRAEHDDHDSIRGIFQTHVDPHTTGCSILGSMYRIHHDNRMHDALQPRDKSSRRISPRQRACINTRRGHCGETCASFQSLSIYIYWGRGCSLLHPFHAADFICRNSEERPHFPKKKMAEPKNISALPSPSLALGRKF